MPQEPLWVPLVDERRKRAGFCTSPDVQLNHILTVINASPEGWRVPHFNRRGPGLTAKPNYGDRTVILCKALTIKLAMAEYR